MMFYWKTGTSIHYILSTTSFMLQWQSQMVPPKTVFTIELCIHTKICWPYSMVILPIHHCLPFWTIHLIINTGIVLESLQALYLAQSLAKSWCLLNISMSSVSLKIIEFRKFKWLKNIRRFNPESSLLFLLLEKFLLILQRPQSNNTSFESVLQNCILHKQTVSFPVYHKTLETPTLWNYSLL